MRKMIGKLLGAAALACALLGAGMAQATEKPAKATKATVKPGMLVVTDFGAKGDGKTDDTAAFQKALDAAAKGGRGGDVFVPRGEYLIAGRLVIPDWVTLQGVFQAPPSSDKFWNTSQRPATPAAPLEGTVLLTTVGEGQAEGDPFITLSTNSVLKGLSILHPNQVRQNPPKPYPWTVGIKKGGANNSAIIDVLMVNPYQAVDFGSQASGRHLVRNLYAYPLFKGIYVDRCYDIGRLENIHFWPFWGYTGDNDPVGRFVTENATAFIFGRSDWEYVTNCFSIFYNKGFHFITCGDKGMGPGNYLLTQSGADCSPIAVQVDEVQSHAGISFSNSQIFGRVVVAPSNVGPVRFTGCGFFGATREKKVGETAWADIAGTGHVSFSNCHFFRLDPANTAKLGVRATGGGLSIQNCLFIGPRLTPVTLGEGVRTAIIAGNTLRDQEQIVNNSKGKVEMGLNIYDDPTPAPSAEKK